jgi:recombination associated protein RdgC
MILERIYLFEELVRLVNELFYLFLQVRVAEDWPVEREKVRKWVNNSVKTSL